MSMAVVNDNELDDLELPPPQDGEQAEEQKPEPSAFEILARQAWLRFCQTFRYLWRPVAVFVRSVFWLEEDSLRDQYTMANRADVEHLAKRLAGALQGVNLLNERLNAHEEAIPRMRIVRQDFDAKKKAEKEARESQMQRVWETQQERAERLAAGIVS